MLAVSGRHRRKIRNQKTSSQKDQIEEGWSF